MREQVEQIWREVQDHGQGMDRIVEKSQEIKVGYWRIESPTKEMTERL